MHTKFDYLTIGHVSQDVVSTTLDSSGFSVGGTVSFAAQVADALGCRAAVLTSAAPDFDAAAAIPDATVAVVDSAETTSFSNIYTESGRKQIVHSLADPISAEHIPQGWNSIPLVHLGPITPLIDPELIYQFPTSIIGITPQGWMRTWDDNGHIEQIPLLHRDILLPNADAVIIGEEDLTNPAELDLLRQKARLLVMTRSAAGCVVFEGENVYSVPAPKVKELNATGAGDIFATAFFIQLWRSKMNVLQSAEFANKIAAASVTQPDLAAKVALTKNLTTVDNAPIKVAPPISMQVPTCLEVND